MPSAMVDTTYPDSDMALRICRLLGPYADALPMRLWCWGVATGRESGRFEADAKQLASVVKFSGNPEELLAAFLACGVIEKTKKPNEFRIKGWSVNAKYFNERNRLRKYNATRGKRVDNARKTRLPRVDHGSTSTSTSTKESTRAHVGTNHPEVAFFEADYRKRFGGPPLTAAERAKAFEIIRQCGLASVKWQTVLEFYAAGFAFSGHTVDWLARNLREVLNKQGPAPAPKPRMTEEQQRQAQREQMEREEAEAVRKWEQAT